MIAKLPIPDEPIDSCVSNHFSTRGQIKSWLALLLTLLTAAAVVLMVLGTLFPHPSWQHWGEIFSIPAILLAGFPFLCIGLLLLIWTARGTVRLAVPSAFPRRTTTVPIDPVRRHELPERETKVALTDDQIFAFLRALDARDPLSRKNRSDWASSSGTVSSAEKDADLADPANSSDSNSPASTLPANPVMLALARGLECVEVESARNSYVLKVPANHEALLPGSVFEETCREFLKRPQQVERLVIDGRQLDSESTERLCDCLIRLARSVSDYAVHTLRVVFSESLLTFINRLSDRVKEHTSGWNPRAVVLLYAALLTICLGPPPHLH